MRPGDHSPLSSLLSPLSSLLSPLSSLLSPLSFLSLFLFSFSLFLFFSFSLVLSRSLVVGVGLVLVLFLFLVLFRFLFQPSQSNSVHFCDWLTTVASPWQHAWMIRTLLRFRRVAKCWRCAASAAASGSSAPEFIRLPQCEITAANKPDGY